MDLTFIKEMYEKYQNSNEANIQNHVVANLLELLGYDKTEFQYEHPTYHKNGRTDIAVKVNDFNYLFIEVKKPSNPLTEKEKSQLISYLAISGLTWGILTNGREYFLMNNDIGRDSNDNLRDTNKDKVVFNVDIFNKKDIEFLNYFSKSNLFDTCITNYFKHIAHFKAKKYPDGGRSWNNYKGTLFDFFKFYSEKQGKYRDLNYIRVDEFEEFLKYEMDIKNSKNNGKKIRSLETSNNKLSHIRSFFKELNIKNNDFFNESKDELISRLGTKEIKEENEEVLSDESICTILNFYDTRRDSVRNKVIFLLCLTFGLERSTLLSLKLNNFKSNKLLLQERELIIPKKLLVLLEELRFKNEMNKTKGDYLFYSRYNNKFNPISESQINYTFDILQDIDKDNATWRKLNPAYIRHTLIKKLFKKNYSIEEIVYLTGADLSTISNLLLYEMIINQVKLRKQNINKTHPFEAFLD